MAVVQLPGAVLDSLIRRAVAAPLMIVGVLIVVAALLLHPMWRHPRPRGGRLVGAAAVAFAIAAAMAQVATLVLTREVVEVSDIGILVPTAGKSTECRGQPRRCHELVLNELGFRGDLVRRATDETRLVAFIGDSHVFGSGVGEQDTVPAVVARDIADMRPPVAVVNAGIPGINGGSFPGVVRYVITRLQPDLLVVLIKDDDLDETDKFTRWALFRRSFWFRMLSVTNLEVIYETLRQAGRFWFGQRAARVAMATDLDHIAGAAAGSRLLLVAAFSEDLQPTFDTWISAHPEVASVTSWRYPEFWDAERIPYDGHWTEAGSRTIAGIVTPRLREQLNGGGEK